MGEYSAFTLMQVTLETITNTSMEDVYDITLGDGFWDMFVEARQNAIQSGNLVSFEIAEINGGINTNGNDVCFASSALFACGKVGAAPGEVQHLAGIVYMLCKLIQ